MICRMLMAARVCMTWPLSTKPNMGLCSIFLIGTAKQEVAAIAFHQALREFIGAMYMIEFCVGEDPEIREIYERTISPIYRS